MESKKVKNEFVEMLDKALEAGKQVLEELRKENKMKDSAVWVKCSDRLPGYKTRVKWRDGNNHSYATDGTISLFEMEKPNLDGWEWLDESTPAGREEGTDVFVPCTEGDPARCGGYTSDDGRSLCYVKVHHIPVSVLKQKEGKK